MKKSMFLIFLLAVLFIFAAQDVLAAWTQAKGHSYNALGLSHYRTANKYSTALTRATRLRDRLIARRVPFHEATSHGDRFLYHTNYVRRTAQEVAADFGPDLQQRIFSLEPDAAAWQGPFRSAHGWHLVMLTEQLPQSDPSLEQIRTQVERDARRAQREAQLQESIESVVSGYTVSRDPSLRAED